jgi:hypothetical protein
MHLVFVWILQSALSQAPAVPPPDAPTPVQILTGQALNDLLLKCKDLKPVASPDPPPALPARARGAVNVLAPSGVDASLFLLADSIEWPVALAEAKAERTRLATALSVARKEAAKGKVSDRTVKEVSDAAEKLDKHLVDRIADLTPSEYIHAKRLVNRLKEAGKVVKAATLRADLELAEHAAKIRTTGELVRWMNEKKLRFAGALPGQDEAYQQLYRALADLHRKSAAGRK